MLVQTRSFKKSRLVPKVVRSTGRLDGSPGDVNKSARNAAGGGTKADIQTRRFFVVLALSRFDVGAPTVLSCGTVLYVADRLSPPTSPPLPQ